MGMSIILDTPEQINMWVLLSRRAQLKMQLKGVVTKGLVKWCKANIPGCERARTAKDCVVPVEYAISEAGGPPDYSVVNVHVMEHSTTPGIFVDNGIYSTMEEVEAVPRFVKLFRQGNLEIVLTLEEPREPNSQLYSPA
jgi:hypothetical protein